MATPPHNLILSHLAPSAETATDIILRLIAEDAHNIFPETPGVVGPDALAERFTVHWSRLTRQSSRLDMRERIYRLESVRPIRPVGGVARRIVEADRPLLREWLRAFFREALLTDDHPQAEQEIDSRLRFESSGMYLWQDGDHIVSLAGYGGPTPHGARIGPVYTPPEARGRGYASALVADLSQRLLDQGRQFVFLFTNLANPTANHIYQEIGYQPVSDVAVYAFQPTA
jgi:predicted GNAT family acetyltransferase